MNSERQRSPEFTRAGTGGDIEREFLPPYTPQLNQIENVWRDLKKRLAGRYFKSIGELKIAITGIYGRKRSSDDN